jgi:hypothetical protein
MKLLLQSRLATVLTVFSLTFPVIYTVAYYNEWALFRFYPLVGELHLSPQPTTLGPGMIYYSWLVVSSAVALLIGLLIPTRWVATLWAGWSWVIPVGATLFTFAYELRWFVH